VDSDICGDDGIDVWVGDISLLLAGDVNELIYIIKANFTVQEKADSGFINGIHDSGHQSAGFTALTGEEI